MESGQPAPGKNNGIADVVELFKLLNHANGAVTYVL
jgi:hypothetical protein